MEVDGDQYLSGRNIKVMKVHFLLVHLSGLYYIYILSVSILYILIF